jgi:hypothetical protein
VLKKIIHIKNKTMQHFKSLAAVLIIVVCAASCKKDTAGVMAPTPAVQKKIIEEKNQTSGDFRKYTYDAQGRVSKVESGTHSWTIEYQPQVIKVYKKRISDNVSLGTEEYSIDASGKMISSVWKSMAGAITYSYEYDYDAAGYMVRMKEIYASGEVYEDVVTNPAGNPVTVKNYYNGALHDVTDYYYNADVKNLGTGTPLMSYYGIKGFAGKVPQREISEFKRYDASGGLSFHKVNTFTTDTEGRILNYTASYPVSGLIHNWHITYG